MEKESAAQKGFGTTLTMPAMVVRRQISPDEKDMIRMGRVQELKRMFGPWGLMGFASVTGAVWQYVLLTFIWSLPNGGPSGAVYLIIVCIFGLVLNTLSLAEMASMAPSAGGQYQWISEFAPRNSQKLLSYIVGWLTVLGWQVGLASVCYAVVLQIQGLVILASGFGGFQGWHGALMMMGVGLVAVFFNTVLAWWLPILECGMMVLHVVAYLVFLLVLGVLGQNSTNSEVWNSWENANDWPSLSTAVLIGMDRMYHTTWLPGQYIVRHHRTHPVSETVRFKRFDKVNQPDLGIDLK